MKIITYGEIMDAGTSVFTAVTNKNNDNLTIKFNGILRTDNPYKHLERYIKDMELKLDGIDIKNTIIDFTDLKYCNSNGFYALMDIIEIIYDKFQGPINVKRLKNDDWQQNTLPILFNINNEGYKQRINFEDKEDN